MKRTVWLSLILIFSLLLTACGVDATNNGGPASSNEGTAAENSGFPLTISSTISSSETEEVGTVLYKDITFDAKPEKIVVFDYGFLDTLDALGVGGIVGVPKESSLPASLEKYAAKEYANVGSLKTPLFEDIAALAPDVIFISGRQSIYYEELSEIAKVVFVGTHQDDYWNTFLASVDIAATLFDKEAEAEAFLAKFDSALEEVRALASKYENTLVTMYNEGNLSGFATNSRFGYVYTIYDFVPVTEDIQASSHGSNFGFEAILDFNPEVLFVIDRTAATSVGNTSNIKADLENEIIKRTTAFQNDRIIYLDDALWYLSGGGLQSELAKIEEILAELK